jgi:glycerate kinase
VCGSDCASDSLPLCVPLIVHPHLPLLRSIACVHCSYVSRCAASSSPEEKAAAAKSSSSSPPLCPYLETRNLPLSDGGEGFLNALPSAHAADVDADADVDTDVDVDAELSSSAREGTHTHTHTHACTQTTPPVYGPLGTALPLPACRYYRVLNDVAYVEMACVSGLEAVPESLRNPLNTTTYGTGQLILVCSPLFSLSLSLSSNESHDSLPQLTHSTLHSLTHRKSLFFPH